MKSLKTKILLFCVCLIPLTVTDVLAQKTVIIRPEASNEVLINPGIGFQTFQRFNRLLPGLLEIPGAGNGQV
jgi:hypothetical protein